MVTALSVLAVGLLDALCCLPHPESAVPGAFPKQAISTVPLRGLPSQEVRLNYKARLETWNKQLESYRRNLTFANIELVMGNEIGLGAVADAKPAACKLAAASVRERHAARVEARLQGSVGIHLCLIFRDLLVYRSLSPFTFEAMMENRRAKIKATNGIEPTDDEVCQALMDASQRTSKHFDAMAKEKGQQQITFVRETMEIYMLPFCGLAAITYVAEVCCRYRKKRSPD